MSSWIIPVVLSGLLGPGIGQLYNKEFKKGALLLVLGLVLVAITTVSIAKAMMPYLSQDIAAMDIVQLAELGDKLKSEFDPTRSGLMMACYLMLTAMWIYSIIDAYFGAKRRKQKTLGPGQDLPG